MLLTIKFYGKRYPRLKWLRPIGPISACVVAIIAVVAGDLQDKGIKIVGHIPAGRSGDDVRCAPASQKRYSSSRLLTRVPKHPTSLAAGGGLVSVGRFSQLQACSQGLQHT